VQENGVFPSDNGFAFDPLAQLHVVADADADIRPQFCRFRHIGVVIPDADGPGIVVQHISAVVLVAVGELQQPLPRLPQQFILADMPGAVDLKILQLLDP